MTTTLEVYLLTDATIVMDISGRLISGQTEPSKPASKTPTLSFIVMTDLIRYIFGGIPFQPKLEMN